MRSSGRWFIIAAAVGALLTGASSAGAQSTTLGPCGVHMRTLSNPRSGPSSPVWVFEPTGSGHATVTGGKCDAARHPAVFVAHGYALRDPALYQGLIDHLVSVGNVVVFPAYDVSDHDGDGDIDRSDLEESYRVVDAGIRAAVDRTSHIDTSRVGWWGHSHGGGMIPWLAQRGVARGWGTRALWLSNVAQAYTQLVGTGPIHLPERARAMTIAFGDDAFADKRLGIDVFESLTVPASHKHHVTISSDPHGQPALVADHGTPIATDGHADALDFLLWRYSDLLERCALTGRGCDADLATVGTWSDGTPITEAQVSRHPIDSGPTPATLAECDSGFASGLTPLTDLNPRRDRCGVSRP